MRRAYSRGHLRSTEVDSAAVSGDRLARANEALTRFAGDVNARLSLAHARVISGLLITVVALCWACFAIARFRTFHNVTFDLAFYTRMAWGLSRWDFWDPVLQTNVMGLHLSPVLGVLGFLGHVAPLPEALLTVQAFALAGAAWPIGKLAEKHGGSLGMVGGVALFLLYPNLTHVATYEMHPGSLAILPIAWAVYACMEERGRLLIIATIGVALCREDLCAITAILGLLAWSWDRRVALITIALSCVPIVLFLFVFHPRHAPAGGSFDVHFGHWRAADDLMAHALHHFSTTRRLAWIPLTLAPVAFVSLFAPKWLLATLPVFGVTLLSAFPTTTDLDVHYLTPAVPVIVAAAVAGMRSLPALVRPLVGAVSFSALLLVGFGMLDGDAFKEDARTFDARAAVAHVDDGASVMAPYPLMPHLAERTSVHPSPLPDRASRFVILDVSHRQRFVHDESLLRTEEEPRVADWLAREDFELVHANASYLVMRKRDDAREERLATHDDALPLHTLTGCLGLHAIERANVSGEEGIALVLHAYAPCPRDLVVRIKSAGVVHTDLLFSGIRSPEHLRAGQDARSLHAIPVPRDQVTVSLRRTSGARPRRGDPDLTLPVR